MSESTVINSLDCHYVFLPVHGSRSPSNIVTSQNASPRVIASKLLGGVDQATLRQSLTDHSNPTTPTEYLTDAEVQVFSDQLKEMEALQLLIVTSDLQVQ